MLIMLMYTGNLTPPECIHYKTVTSASFLLRELAQLNTLAIRFITLIHVEGGERLKHCSLMKIMCVPIIHLFLEAEEISKREHT